MLGISLICCAVLAEHVSSNASDSESSYRKLLLWFAVLFFATAPLPVVVISKFCCCFSIATFCHLIQSKWLEMKSALVAEKHRRH